MFGHKVGLITGGEIPSDGPRRGDTGELAAEAPRQEQQRKLEEEREKQRQLELERQRERDRDLGWEL